MPTGGVRLPFDATGDFGMSPVLWQLDVALSCLLAVLLKNYRTYERWSLGVYAT